VKKAIQDADKAKQRAGNKLANTPVGLSHLESEFKEAMAKGQLSGASVGVAWNFGAALLNASFDKAQPVIIPAERGTPIVTKINALDYVKDVGPWDEARMKEMKRTTTSALQSLLPLRWLPRRPWPGSQRQALRADTQLRRTPPTSSRRKRSAPT
tara:strand:- start:801 stop:1265 length:465 start_codon:yes stop_codon:yes gene_type:complete